MAWLLAHDKCANATFHKLARLDRAEKTSHVTYAKRFHARTVLMLVPGSEVLFAREPDPPDGEGDEPLLLES